ncbi:hypothetical protein GCM10025875_28880 [Litorihabitans aurantiacus]|uniref:Uncharacterized protein n=1 Tax=Litorihabitans aurantiacus TaxID=1930061 RepID=A0AA37XGI4_9MICO|nr:hypothetical protein GCM10025875_28880 [Litorihabitans aurantiacus]
MVGADDVAVVQERAVAPVERDPGGDLGERGRVLPPDAGEVPLDPEVAEQRRDRAEGERLRAAGRVRAGRTDVGTHELRRDEQTSPPLRLLPFQRVEAVAGPDPVRPLEYPEVDAPAARGAGLDLQVGVARPQLVQQPVERQGLVAHAGTAGRGVARVHEIAVVVPLEVVDAVLRHEGVQAPGDVPVGVGVGEVQDLLPARGRGHPVAAGHDPVRVGAGEVGVRADHLRLDPQPHLHAAGADVVHERVEAAGPHVGVDVPVPQRDAVVAPAAEPPVVEHEALDPDLGRGVGELGQHVEVVVEVDRLPGVEHDGAGVARVVRAGAQVRVEAGRDGVEAIAVGGVDRRCRVPLTGGEDDLAGQQELTAAQQRRARGDALRDVDVVAAPRRVDRPRLTRAEPDAGRRGDHQEGRVGPRAPAAALAHVGAEREVVALRRALTRPATREVQQLARLRRDRQEELQAVEDVVGRTRVAQVRRRRDQARGQEGEAQRQGEVEMGVDGVDGDGSAGGGGDRGVVDLGDLGDLEEGREARPVPVALEARGPAPPDGRLRQDADGHLDVHRVERDRRSRRLGEREQRVRPEIAEVGAPVHHPGQPGAAGVEDETDAGGAQVAHGGGWS